MWKPFAAAAVAATLLAPTRAAALENEELLAVVAMPLAVAAVSEFTGVPIDAVIDAVSLLNAAAVPPPQFIEVVRYMPVALVTQTQADEPDFVEFIRLRQQEGLRGTQLVTSIEERMSVYGLPAVELDVDTPRTIDVIDETFIPAPVRTRLAELRSHPHGGPPGQLKKQRGSQTGAEVVHVAKPNGTRRVDDEHASERVVTRVVPDGDRGRGNERREHAVGPRKAERHSGAVARASNGGDGRGNVQRGGRGRGNGGGGNVHGRGNGGGNGQGGGKGKGKG